MSVLMVPKDDVVFPSLGGQVCAWIEENHPARWCKMRGAFMGKGLKTSFDETNHVVIVTVTRIGVMNIERLQKSDVKPSVMPDLRPFLSWHDYSAGTGRLTPGCTTISPQLSYRILPWKDAL